MQLLASESTVRIPAIIKCPSIADHPGIDVLLAQVTYGHDPLVAVTIFPDTTHPGFPYELSEGEGGLLATAPGLAICGAALLSLGRVYPKQPYALVTNLDGVAVDDPWPAGDVGQHGV